MMLETLIDNALSVPPAGRNAVNAVNMVNSSDTEKKRRFLSKFALSLGNERQYRNH
jgi:hypothetical protein